MLPDQYVWLAWSFSFLVPWLLLYGRFPRYRILMLWGSVMALPFGLSEPLFLGRYWQPPSLFNLARVAHFDLETFIFCFGIGGVAAVLYNIVTGRPVAERAKRAWTWWAQFLYNLAFATPLFVFCFLLGLTREPIWAGVGGMIGGALARVVCRPDLLAKTCLGGLLFLGYYVLFLLLLRGMAPGYMERVWNATGPAGMRVFGLPLTELLFAGSFGMYWSGLYEHVVWTLPWPTRPGPA